MMTTKRLAALLCALAALAVTAPAASATTYITGSQAYADAQDWAGDQCDYIGGGPGSCVFVAGSSVYDVNPGAPSGTVQWDTYTLVCVAHPATPWQWDEYKVYAGFGPYAGTETHPIKWRYWQVPVQGLC